MAQIPNSTESGSVPLLKPLMAVVQQKFIPIRTTDTLKTPDSSFAAKNAHNLVAENQESEMINLKWK